MRKLSLSDWASVAEIAATVAVVVSLIFVAISLERNTAVMQASNENFIAVYAEKKSGEIEGP